MNEVWDILSIACLFVAMIAVWSMIGRKPKRHTGPMPGIVRAEQRRREAMRDEEIWLRQFNG